MYRHNDPLPTTHCEFYIRAYIETTLYHMYFFSFTYNSIQLLGMWSKTFILIYKPLSHHTRTHTPITSHSNNSILHIPQSHHTQVHTPITSYIPQSQHTQIIPTHTPITSHSSTYMYPNHIILKYISLLHHTQVHTPIISNHIILKYIPQSQHTQITHTKSR